MRTHTAGEERASEAREGKKQVRGFPLTTTAATTARHKVLRIGVYRLLVLGLGLSG